MISLNLDKKLEFADDYFPKSWVFYRLRSSSGVLYTGYCARLSAKMRQFKAQKEEDPLISELFNKAEYLDYEVADSGLAALALFKINLQHEAPEYQFRIHPFSHYVYLALDAYRFPFISIQETTNDDWQYLGPWRSRFFLVDIIDSLSRILKLPNCETGTYPCDKLDSGACRGWCMNLVESPNEPSEDSEIPAAPPTESKSPEHSLEKLDALLKEAFIHPNNGIYEMVQKERDAYFDDLEFAKADLLDDELRLLGKYRDWLNFLFVAKNLEYSDDTYEIREGQLISAKHKNKEYQFTSDSPPYRENETLALPLNKVDEMKVIYDYIREQSNAR